MRWVIAVGKTALAIIGAAGAVACILVWLEVKPKDVRMMSWPHWLWLIGALLLFAFSIGFSAYTFFRQKRIDPQLADFESIRLREHLKDAEQRADRLLQGSKQIDQEKTALEQTNQQLEHRVSELQQRWNNSALLSGQFLQEASTLSGELIYLWLTEHCQTRAQFSSASIAENIGISQQAALHGLEWLQGQQKLVSRPLQNVDGWEYMPSTIALQSSLKATTRLNKRSLDSFFSPLQIRVFDLARQFQRESQDFLRANPPPPVPNALALSGDYAEVYKKHLAWKERLSGWYRSAFAGHLQQISDELAAHGHSDSELKAALAEMNNGMDYAEDKIMVIVRKLKALALSLE